MQRSLLPKSLALTTGLALLSTAPIGPVPARAASLPELLITEIVPASSGTGQPYEFVEVYNTTAHPVSLDNYKLLYYTSSPYQTPANRWTITGKVIPPRLRRRPRWAPSPGC